MPTYLPSNSSTKKILKIIKNASPEDYSYMCKNVNVINKNVSCGGFDGGCYNSRKLKTLYIGNDQRNESLAAMIVIHELCHRQQMIENRSFSQTECYEKGSDFLENTLVY